MERVKTGIKGLDKLLYGGFPRGSTILVTGGPGTGKTSFCLNFLINGALKYNERGVYISLEEKPERLIHNVKNVFSWPVEDLVNRGLIKFIKTELYDFEKLKRLVEDEIDKSNVKRLVIDPSTVISLFFENPLQIRRSMIELYDLLKELGCTSLLTCEIPEGQGGISTFGVEEFICDGIIVLYFFGTEGGYFRGLMIRKMRTTQHSVGVYPMKITKHGVVVYPEKRR